MQRKTDAIEAVHFQADRIHNLNGRWYFLTREGGNIGPFESKRQAEKSLRCSFIGNMPISGPRADASGQSGGTPVGTFWNQPYRLGELLMGQSGIMVNLQ